MKVFSNQKIYLENLATCANSERTAMKRFILLPHTKQCCGEAIIIRNRPSFPIVYTTDGTFIGALFTGECRKGCSKNSYYYCEGQMHYHDPK